MKFLYTLLLTFFFTPLLAIPLADAISSFLGLNERDIDISADPRNYKRRRWLKPEERWGNLPTSTLEHWKPWQTGSGGGGGGGPHKHPHFPIPGPWHHKPPKGGKKPINQPWPFGEANWPFADNGDGLEKELVDTQKEIEKEIFGDNGN